MAEQKLNLKNYAIWDRSPMLFGSVMNRLQGTPYKSTAELEEIWQWCKEKTTELIDELYAKNETGNGGETPL